MNIKGSICYVDSFLAIHGHDELIRAYVITTPTPYKGGLGLGPKYAITIVDTKAEHFVQLSPSDCDKYITAGSLIKTMTDWRTKEWAEHHFFS